jgi:hypothetical protein
MSEQKAMSNKFRINDPRILMAIYAVAALIIIVALIYYYAPAPNPSRSRNQMPVLPYATSSLTVSEIINHLEANPRQGLSAPEKSLIIKTFSKPTAGKTLTPAQRQLILNALNAK